MSREDGFEIADIDTGLLSDSKVLALARRIQDPVFTGAAIALYHGLVLASWKEGRRLTLGETVPAWWLEPFDNFAAELVAVGLIDDEQRIPLRAWRGWFGPAVTRRLEARRKSIYGGLVSHGMTGADANREADTRIARERERLLDLEPELVAPTSITRPPSDRPTVRPTKPFSPGATSSKKADARRVEELTADVEAWRAKHPEVELLAPIPEVIA